MSAKAVEVAINKREDTFTQDSLPMGDLATRCEDTQTAALSLSMLNVGYPSSSISDKEGELEGGLVSGRDVNNEVERASLAPETPQRAARPNPGKERSETETKCAF